MARNEIASDRSALRLRPKYKGAFKRTDVDRLVLSERDSLCVFNLLENPPSASDRLIRAARAGFTLE